MTANEPQINSKEVQTTALIETLRFLEEQIREKDKQIQEKDDQISDLIESLQNEQKLNAMNQNKILELEEKGKENEVVEQEEKKKGVAVIYVGEDLDVLLEMCDRIMVMCGGKISGIVDARTTTKEEVGLLMTRLQEKGGIA